MDVQKYVEKANRFKRRMVPQRWQMSVPHPALAEALGRWSTLRSDIHDHLCTIFFEIAAARPRLIVELGTRGGVSLRALLAVAEATDAQVLSVDIEDCSAVDIPERFRRRWTFLQDDDVALAGQPFEQFCAARGLPAVAEAILVDTSHVLEHTRAEIRHWVPRLAVGGVMMFHDTNMGGGWYRTLDGGAEYGWDNERGVIRAIEEVLGRRYDESSYFCDLAEGFAISHVPWSNGFTVLRKL